MLNYWIRLGLVDASEAQSSGSGENRAFNFADVFRLALVAHLRRLGVPTAMVTPAMALVTDMGVGPKSELNGSCLVLYATGEVNCLSIEDLPMVMCDRDHALAVLVHLGVVQDGVLAGTMEWALRTPPKRGRKPGAVESGRLKSRRRGRRNE